MPWRQTSPLDQRTPFIAADLRDRLAVTERCELYGVSRKTGDQGLARNRRHSPRASQSAPVGPAPRPAKRPTRWWQRASTPGAGLHPGAPSSCGRSGVHALPAGRGLHARPSVPCSAATASCPRRASAASSGLLAHPPAPWMRPTTCGVRPSQGRSNRVTATTALR